MNICVDVRKCVLYPQRIFHESPIRYIIHTYRFFRINASVYHTILHCGRFNTKGKFIFIHNVNKKLGYQEFNSQTIRIDDIIRHYL